MSIRNKYKIERNICKINISNERRKLYTPLFKYII